MPNYTVRVDFHVEADDEQAARCNVLDLLHPLETNAYDVGEAEEGEYPYELEPCICCGKVVRIECATDLTGKVWCTWCDHEPVCFECGSQNNPNSEPSCPECRRKAAAITE